MMDDIKPLRILSIGAGAIGTYIGGSLSLQGHEVVFLERPHVADSLKQRKIRLPVHPVAERKYLEHRPMFKSLDSI